ncbi:MAG: hypothetical protein M1824_003637 [Vezdaea acicularis]|nr:MAG: hypothetical protein M1824_003637 [Vezdaea acicularis]
MASIETLTRKRELEDAKSPLSKKIKVSDLPLANTQRSAIDGLVHNFKKNGSFDELRKKAWAKFEESEDKTSFLNALPAIAEAKIDEDPAILSKDRGKATTLVEGAVDRAKVYDIVGSNFRALFNEEYPEALEKVRAMRRKDVGEEQAASEQQRGNKTDEEYSAETRSRLAERRRIREEEELKQREAERAEARRRRQEEERQQEEAREQEAQEKIERDKAREAERERRRKAEQDYDRERAEERERKQRHEREREREWEQEERRRRDRDRDWDRGRHKGRDKELAMEDTQASPWRVDDRNDDYASSGAERSDKKLPIVLAPEDEEALAEEALSLLLREGQEAAAKSRQRPEQDRSESLEPPTRRVASSRSSRRDSLAHIRGRAILDLEDLPYLLVPRVLAFLFTIERRMQESVTLVVGALVAAGPRPQMILVEMIAVITEAHEWLTPATGGQQIEIGESVTLRKAKGGIGEAYDLAATVGQGAGLVEHRILRTPQKLRRSLSLEQSHSGSAKQKHTNKRSDNKRLTTPRLLQLIQIEERNKAAPHIPSEKGYQLVYIPLEAVLDLVLERGR